MPLAPQSGADLRQSRMGSERDEMGICYFRDLIRLFTYQECGGVGPKHIGEWKTFSFFVYPMPCLLCGHSQLVPGGGAVEL